MIAFLLGLGFAYLLFRGVFRWLAKPLGKTPIPGAGRYTQRGRRPASAGLPDPAALRMPPAGAPDSMFWAGPPTDS